MKDVDITRGDILFEEEGRASVVTLNRPGALNALTLDMIRGLEAHLLKWARAPKIYGVLMQASGDAFCAGGDLKLLRESILAGDLEGAERYFREEYQHCWTLQQFIKPHVALIDGAMMGGGVGVCLYGTHRVAGERFSFAMPETGVGFFPDVGASYFLSHMPGRIGLYLGLTGERVGRADALRLGVATHCIDAQDFPAIRRALVESDPIDQALDALHADPGEGELAALAPAIDRIFGAGGVGDILSALDAERGRHEEWARRTAAGLRRRSPLALKATHRLIDAGRGFTTLKDALAVEFRVAMRFLREPDLLEGVRAALIDKDGAPQWRPTSLGEATDDSIERLLSPLPAAEAEAEFKNHWTLVE